jgi:hypothetical protein
MQTHHLTTILAALLCAGGACDGKPEAKAGGADVEAKAGGADAEAKAGEAPGHAKAGDEQGAPVEGDRGEAAPAGTATCATASANLLKLMQPELDKQLQDLPEDQRAAVEQQMKQEVNLEAVIAQCEQQQPDQKELDCVANAASLQDLQACQGPPPGAGAPPPGPGAGAPLPNADG